MKLKYLIMVFLTAILVLFVGYLVINYILFDIKISLKYEEWRTSELLRELNYFTSLKLLFKQLSVIILIPLLISLLVYQKRLH